MQSEPIEVLDVNKLSAESEIAVRGMVFSGDGNLFAYGLSSAGSEWIEIKIREVHTGKDLSDVLTKVKFTSISWMPDNKGLFYCVSHFLVSNQFKNSRVSFICLCAQQFPESDADAVKTQANYYQKLYYHRLGELQEDDVLVVEFPENPHWLM